MVATGRVSRGDDPPEPPEAAPPYLLALRLAGRRVTIIGGGAVAARRIPGLLDSGADVVVVSPELTPMVAERAGQIRWIRRGYVPGDCAGSWLVGAWTNDPDVNAAVAREADAAGIWCVRADDAAASRAWTPASGRSGDVRVGVVTGDPRYSAGIRDAIVDALSSGEITAPRGRAPRAGREGEGRESLRGGEMRGWVALVGSGPGDPGLITVRGRQLLSRADVVVADRLAPRSLLAELPPAVEVVDAAKIPRGAAVAQEHINSVLIANAREGRFVVRLKGGDPFVFGRGGEEVLACLRAGIPVVVVPGVSSAAAVPAAAGVPLTHRGIAQEFHVVSAHVAPGDERSAVDWKALATSRATLVLMMATEHLQIIAKTLIRHGRNAQTPVSVITDGTLPSQRTISTRLDSVAHGVAGAEIRPPAVVVVGEVVTISEQIAQLCGGLADGVPWGTFAPGGAGGTGTEEGSSAGSSPDPGAAGRAGDV
jgi:uroporphyrin-III C-methyltransferase / precorrin-2 dehydrogenase / sirohydrochlorin ferrochelatase